MDLVKFKGSILAPTTNLNKELDYCSYFSHPLSVIGLELGISEVCFMILAYCSLVNS